MKPMANGRDMEAHSDARLRVLETEQRHLWRAIEILNARVERRRQAIEEINARISSAILWLAVAAGGLVISIARAKLGF